MQKSLSKKSKKLTDEQLIAPLSDALLRLPVGTVANICGATETSVKNWRARRHDPSLTKALRLAMGVESIKMAIFEILGVERPETNRLIAVLLSHLAAIAIGPDELSAAKARKALEEFKSLVSE